MSIKTGRGVNYGRVKRILVPTLIIAALACGSYWLSRSVAFHRAVHAASVQVAPFTMTMNFYDFTRVPTGSYEGQEILAQRSDGAIMKQLPFLRKADGELSGLTSRQLTFPDGRDIWVVDSIAAKATWPPLTGDRLTAYLNSLTKVPADCINPGSAEKLLEHSAISGEVADMIELPSIAGKTTVQWRVPSLGCPSIQYQIQEHKGDGSVKVIFEGKLMSLHLGEPSAALFRVGGSYAEMRPSQIIQAALAKIGEANNPMARRDGQQLDASYLRGRSH